jgi:cytochrome P450 family 9
MKDLFKRYTNDVIATSAFGIGCDSLKNPKNEFYEMGKDVTNFAGVRALIFFGYMLSPKLMKVRILYVLSKTVNVHHTWLNARAIRAIPRSFK